ncbi:condensation domain-containing protein [Streptomyces sp. NPDC004270]
MDVQFSGLGTRESGITWAQEDIYGFVYGDNFQVRRKDPDLRYAVNLRDGVPPEAARAAVLALVARHEALRTRFTPGNDGFRSQYVADEGTVLVRTCNTGAAGVEEAAARLTRLLTEEAIDVTTEFPVRFGFVLAAGLVRRVIVAASHMVVDGWGLENLLADLRRHLTDSKPDDDASVRPGFHQIDQWQWERSRHGTMRAAAALEYRRKLLRESSEVPRRKDILFTSARPIRHGELQLGADFLTYVESAAKELVLSTSAVLLTLCARAASTVLGVDRLIFHLHCANRFGPPQDSSVTCLKSMSLMPYEAGAASFRDEARQTWKSLLIAHHHAQCPPAEAEQLRSRVDHPFFMEFNDTRLISDRGDENPPTGNEPVRRLTDSAVTVVESNEVATDPRMKFSIGTDPYSSGSSVTLESNFLTDDEMVRTIFAVAEFEGVSRSSRLP